MAQNRPRNPYLLPPHQRPCSTACQCFIFTLVVSAFVAGVITLYILSHVHPPQLHVHSVTVSPFYVYPFQITAAWNILFLIKNPNRWTAVRYEQMRASVYYNGVFLWSTDQPPFSQAEEERTWAVAAISASSAALNDTVSGVISAEYSRGAVAFGLNVDARVRFRPVAWPFRRRSVRGRCEDVKVAFLASNTGGSMLAKSKECTVTMH